ncbi:MAG: LamG-like jellyroll fold domain-containing protein, partial [Bacteroidota bacterium]
AGMSLRTNNELRYHWNDNGYNFSSGLLLPDNQWSHVALVVTPTGVTLYLNGKAATNEGAQPLEAFDAPIQVGYDNGSRYFKGLVDEVCVYERALTQEEVRTQMHLAKSHTDRTGLRTYYQFDENQGLVLDRINTNHGSVAGNGARVRSTAPFGPGVAFLKTVNSGKRHTFGPTGLTLVFGAGATLPLGDLAATRLNIKPDTLSATTNGAPQYWILENFGTNQTFTAPTEIYFDHYGPLPADLNARAIKLLRRIPNGDGLNWNLIDSADYVTAGFDASVIFKSSNQLKTAGQYYLSAPGVFSVNQAVASKPIVAERASVWAPEIQVYPNPVAVNGRCNISANTDGLLRFRLFDSNGHAVKLLRFERNATLDLKDLKAGVYFYQIENEHFIKSGQLLIY